MKKYIYLKVDIFYIMYDTFMNESVKKNADLKNCSYYFKLNEEEYNFIYNKFNLLYLIDQFKTGENIKSRNKKRQETTYKQLYNILSNNKIIGIYKFEFNKNILMKDIESEIYDYLLETEYPLSHYKIELKID